MSNNILLACERCRGQKLRCDWSTVRPDACCDRCTRLGVPCVRNPQRRVGRPRSRLINRSSDSPPRRPTVATDPLVTPLHAPEQTWPADLPRWPKQLEQQQRQQQPVEGFWDGTQYPTAISSVTQTSSLAQISYPVTSIASGALDFSPHLLATEIEGQGRSYIPKVTASPGVEALEALNTDLPKDVHRQASADGAEGAEGADGAAGYREYTNEECVHEVAKLATHLMKPQRIEDAPKEGSEWSSTATFRDVLRHTHALTELAARLLDSDMSMDRTLSTASAETQVQTLPANRLHQVDQPTRLLLLSCYTKLLQSHRQIFTNIYLQLRNGADMNEMLCDLRIDDVLVLGGDAKLEILVLFQVVTYKLNELAAKLGVPVRHQVGCPQFTSGAESHSSPGDDDLYLDGMMAGTVEERLVFGSHQGDCGGRSRRPMGSSAAAFREELCEIIALLGRPGVTKKQY